MTAYNIVKRWWISLLVIVMHVFSIACTDFNQFDCFNDESGCSSPSDNDLSTPMNPQAVMPRESESSVPSPSMSCAVDELAICEACSASGDLELARTDERCPRVECMDKYILIVSAEAQTCYVSIKESISNGLCYERGVCHTESTLCMEIDRGIEEHQSRSSCFEIKGCEGTEPPRLVRKNLDRCH